MSPESTVTRAPNPERLMTDFPPVSTQEWEAVIEKDLKGADYVKKLLTKTFESITIKPYYRRENLSGVRDAVEAQPGEFPYVRGRNPASNRWSICQDILAADIRQANQLAIQALETGATEITFVSGVDANRLLYGQPVQTQADMDALLEGIYLDCAPINFDWGVNSPIALAMLVNNAKKRQMNTQDIQGAITYDPLGAMISGCSSQGVDAINARLKDLLQYAKSELPRYRVFSVQGQPYHNAGASAVEELACMLSAAVEYLHRLTAEGCALEDIIPRMSLSVAVSSNYLMEIAKIRALRILWSNLCKQYGTDTCLPAMTHIHAETSMVNKTVYDFNVNLLRSTMEAMAAVVAGVDSLSVRPYDEPLREPTETAYRMARNTQLILMEEAYLDKVVDPAGGTYAIEALTHEIAEKAWQLFLTWEQAGGFVAAAQKGLIQQNIAETRNERMQRLAQRRDVLLGTSQYPNLAENLLSQKTQPKTLSLKAAADTVLVSKPLSEWQSALAGSAQLGALVAGQAQSALDVLPVYRWAETFETIRMNTERYHEKTGKRPKIFLMTMGNPAMRTARATFMANFFGCAGFEILNHAGFATVDEAIAKVGETKPDVVVLCSADDDYAELGPNVAAALKTKAPNAARVIAGNPTAHIEALKAAGFDDFIHIKTNLVDCLTRYQRQLGVIS